MKTTTTKKAVTPNTRTKWCVWFPLTKKYVSRGPGKAGWTYDRTEAERWAKEYDGEVIAYEALNAIYRKSQQGEDVP